MTKKGFTLIELLIVVAIIAILAAIAVPNFLEAQTRSRVARVQSDQRSLSLAIEAYYVDTNKYPAQASSFPNEGYFGINDIETAPTSVKATEGSARYMPTFRRKVDINDKLYTLTTPISYISSMFPDPFAASKGAAFNYSVAGSHGQSWIIWSYGPDADERIKPTWPTDWSVTALEGQGGDIAIVGGMIGAAKDTKKAPGVETSFYNPNFKIPSERLVTVTYDPTNGTTSNGDVWRAKN